MEMFLEQQVAQTISRMNGVYHHFERNLADIVRNGQRSGVGIVVEHGGGQPQDCPPFASLHRVGLSGPDKTKWDEQYQLESPDHWQSSGGGPILSGSSSNF